MIVTTENLMLLQAEKLCAQRKVRMTPQRREVLRLISQQNKAISAYNLLDLLRQSKPHAKPPTIYRALNFLLAQRFVHRVESTNRFMICNHFTEPLHVSVLFICDYCGLVAEETTNSIKDILQLMATDYGFSILNTIMETHGYCRQCIKYE